MGDKCLTGYDANLRDFHLECEVKKLQDGKWHGTVFCPFQSCRRAIVINCRKDGAFVNSNFKRHLLVHKHRSSPIVHND